MTFLSQPPPNEGKPFSYWFFFREDSRKAADALIDQLRTKGRISEREMSRFASTLETGKLGLRFSKQNFYRGVLSTFVRFGFIAKIPVYDNKTRKTLKVYVPVTQPIPAKRPESPSFWNVTYDFCKAWNEMMFLD